MILSVSPGDVEFGGLMDFRCICHAIFNFQRVFQTRNHRLTVDIDDRIAEPGRKLLAHLAI
jgi:hypothetical protein